jgi:hypothetical protein
MAQKFNKQNEDYAKQKEKTPTQVKPINSVSYLTSTIQGLQLEFGIPILVYNLPKVKD